MLKDLELLSRGLRLQKCDVSALRNCKTIGKLEKCVCFLDSWDLGGLLDLLYFIECRVMWQMLKRYLYLIV